MIFKKKTDIEFETDFVEIRQLNSKMLKERKQLANLFHLKSEILEVEGDYQLSLKNLMRANEISPNYKWQEKIIQLNQILKLL